VRRLSDKVGALRQGVPGGAGSVDVGAVTHPPQLDIVRGHVDEAVAAGARVTVGGTGRSDGGDFYEPTVIVGVDHSMRLMTEETFGPTLPVMRVTDAEEAIRLANDSPYGLGASVWSGDRARGEQLARRLESGFACVNDINLNYFALELPMGGWKASGIGSRHGSAGIRKYTHTQSILVTRLGLKRDPFMFPYRPRTTRQLKLLLRVLFGRGRRD
jgi:acyl-CoA reductase-like NAD-dependent aldehyde dehydrogenase